MGHTVMSQRQMVDYVIQELESYGKALREEDRKIYEEMLYKAFKHVGAIAYTSSIHVWAMVLLSIILEQEKKLRK